jgi:hypothetical protein
MSTAPPSSPGSETGATAHTDRQQILVISHSPLFYWWPVWAFGFFAALWTMVEGHRAVVLPGKAKVASISENSLTLEGGGKTPFIEATQAGQTLNEARRFAPLVSQYPFLGGTFAMVLLLVIIITNIPLRGPTAIITVAAIVILGLLVTQFGLLDKMLEAVFGSLRVYINLSGYVVISTILFLVWLFVVNVFDRSVYIIFTPGQMRVCLEVGGGETSYDTMGMAIEKQRDDPFRHWVLGFAWLPGFGTGDLIVKTSGAQTREIHLPNVLAIDFKLKQVQEMQRDKPTVSG